MAGELKGKGTKLFIGQDTPISSPETFTQIKGLVGVTPPEASVPEIDNTDYDSIAKEFFFGLVDNGTATFQVKYKPSDPVIKRLDALAGTDKVTNFYIQFSDGTTKWSFAALVKSFTPTAGGVDDLVKAQLTLRVTGPVTKTYAA